jgi:hypothetical protein
VGSGVAGSKTQIAYHGDLATTQLPWRLLPRCCHRSGSTSTGNGDRLRVPMRQAAAVSTCLSLAALAVGAVTGCGGGGSEQRATGEASAGSRALTASERAQANAANRLKPVVAAACQEIGAELLKLDRQIARMRTVVGNGHVGPADRAELTALDNVVLKQANAVRRLDSRIWPRYRASALFRLTGDEDDVSPRPAAVGMVAAIHQLHRAASASAQVKTGKLFEAAIGYFTLKENYDGFAELIRANRVDDSNYGAGVRDCRLPPLRVSGVGPL